MRVSVSIQRIELVAVLFTPYIQLLSSDAVFTVDDNETTFLDINNLANYLISEDTYCVVRYHLGRDVDASLEIE